MYKRSIELLSLANNSSMSGNRRHLPPPWSIKDPLNFARNPHSSRNNLPEEATYHICLLLRLIIVIEKQNSKIMSLSLLAQGVYYQGAGFVTCQNRRRFLENYIVPYIRFANSLTPIASQSRIQGAVLTLAP